MKPPSFSYASLAHLRAALFATRHYWLAAFLFLALVYPTAAQEALQYSLAGQDAAEARKRALENQKFSVKLGPVSMRFSAALGIEGTDNVRLTENSPEADVIFRPQVNAFSQWRVTERNSLSLGLGIGYAKYINATDYDRFFISPDSDLSFDVYVGDFVINLHDRFSYTADVENNPTVSGTGSLARFENTVGIRTVWDLNKTVLSAGYDHVNYISTESGFDSLTHASELFTATVGFQLQPTVQAGIEGGGGLLDYEQPLSQDNQHVSVGLFVSAQLSEYTSFRLSGGYVVYFLDTLGFTNATSTSDAFYLDGSFSQRVSRILTHTLGFGRSLQPELGSQLGSQLLDLWRVHYSATWNLLRETGLGTTFSYEHGSESRVFGETFDRYGFGISLSRTMAKNLVARLGYQFYLKNSDRDGRDYLQNRLVLDVTYAF